ncbi:uncharacterized protein LOC124292250 isoform X3 [Haliotis rubra]|uniref:uncharacterized protein LOC124292250 isoform X2 n=1 Tax=Haliotis rubra TaxID=36100 RepID=UPI001EE562B8|nr:uncharacterized protein LOC124292250 isoform X2 [Haliotis rubra]XP_046585272.1 uncharacterized protein LOC124292250 isoform X3 [Haliotis rubra]
MAVMVVQLNPHFEFRLLKEYSRSGQKEPERKVHSTLSNKPDNQQMIEETPPYERRCGKNCKSDPGFNVQESEPEKHRHYEEIVSEAGTLGVLQSGIRNYRQNQHYEEIVSEAETLGVLQSGTRNYRRKQHYEEIVSEAETLGVLQSGTRNYRRKQHYEEIVSEAETLGVMQSGIRHYRQKQHDVLIVSRETLGVLMGQIKNVLELYVMNLRIHFRAYDVGLRISCSYCKDGKIMTEAEYKMLMMQTLTGSLPVSGLECMPSYSQISFPWFCFDPWLSTKVTERFFNTNPVAGEEYKSVYIETLSTFLAKMKQVCLVFDENDKNIARIREYLESVLGSTVIDIYHSFDAGKTEIENIEKCISTSEYFIFIPTRGETSCILKYALNLIVSELFHSSGQNNILTLTDSTQNTCSIPPLLWPFPIFICNFDHNWCRCIWPVVNETDPVINTNVKMSNFTNRISCIFKTLKSVRIISDDIEEGELIKTSIILQSPTTKVTVNDDDVPCGALLFYEYAAKLCEDQLFVIVPSRERSCESEYALRVIFSRLNKELDTLRIQCAETITAIDCCTQSYTRSFHFR